MNFPKPASKTLAAALLSCAIAFAGALVTNTARADHHEGGDKDKNHEIIEKTMKQGHKAPKGTDDLGKKLAKGTATDKEALKLIRMYIAMESTTPPQGDVEVWKKMTKKLTNTAIMAFAGKEGAAKAFNDAKNCKACHSKYKPD
jgi:hypothetical protein